MTAPRVLIYDGDCQFCQLSLEFGIKSLAIFPPYVAFQRINPADFGLTKDQVRAQIWLASKGASTESPVGGHLAAAEILRMQPGWFLRLAGIIIANPPISWFAGMIYRLVARYRHLMPGGSRQCKLEDNYSE